MMIDDIPDLTPAEWLESWRSRAAAVAGRDVFRSSKPTYHEGGKGNGSGRTPHVWIERDDGEKFLGVYAAASDASVHFTWLSRHLGSGKRMRNGHSYRKIGKP